MKIRIRKDSIFTNLKNGFYYVAAGLIALMGLTTGAVAQDWTFDPIIRAGYEIDDNAVMSIRTDEEVEIAGYIADVSAFLGYSSARTKFSIDPRVRVRRYDKEEFDSTDEFVRMNYRHSGQASSFLFRAFYEQEGVRTAERTDIDLEAEDPDDLTNDDTGLIQIGGDRNKLRLRPSLSYRLSDVSSIGATIDYFDVTYDDVFRDLLTDYTDARADISYSRSISSVTTGKFMVTARNFENDDDVNEFDGLGAMAGFERAISEKTYIKFLVGIDTADFASDTIDSTTDFVADISFVRTLETIRILAQYKRSITANGISIPSIRDNFNLNFTRDLSERISASIGARAYHAKAITGSDIARDYLSLTARLGWRWTSTFTVDFQISHSIIDRGGVLGERADSNRVAVWFEYRPNSPDRS